MRLTFFTFVMLLTTSMINAREHFVEDLNVSEYPHRIFGYSEQALIDGIVLGFNGKEGTLAPHKGQSNNSITSLKASLSCNEVVKLKRPFAKDLVGKTLEFSMFDLKKNSGNVSLHIKRSKTECDLKFLDERKTQKSIHIYPFSNKLSSIQSESTPLATKGDYVLLEDGIDAINKRIEILTGQRVSTESIMERDPEMSIDFSKMPKFDFILFATLQFNHDFISNIIFRILAEHAKRDTPIVVVCNDVLVGEKEQILLNWLQAQSPLIKIMKYRYQKKSRSITERINTIHRVFHTKMIATYSAKHPELNHFISGGRNNSDRYFFENFKKFKDKKYTRFDKELANKWAYFFDLDFYINSVDMVKFSIIEVLKLSKLKIFENLDLRSLDEVSKELTLSVPYNDKKRLEVEYVEAIDKAESEIKILSPYIYFNSNIEDALYRASLRDVKIKIITSASLIGDDMTKKVKTEYDNFLSLRKEYLDVYSHIAPKSNVMHRKAMLIDNNLLMLGSVNLSQRSFIHDIEANFKITSPKTIEFFQKIFKAMEIKSDKFDENFKETFPGKLIDQLGLEHVL